MKFDFLMQKPANQELVIKKLILVEEDQKVRYVNLIQRENFQNIGYKFLLLEVKNTFKLIYKF